MPTAGSAKKEMPSRAQNAAIILPGHVSGVLSPYPTVDNVICSYVIFSIFASLTSAI